MYNTVEKYYGIIDDNIESEMSKKQRSFLLGLIQKYNPQKVVEVGVAEGGTTYNIMEALQHNGNGAKMFSVDIMEKCYKDKSKPTGYIYTERKSSLKNSPNHTMITGKILPQVIDEIGEDVDFVIIDTVHFLPGEILDFLCIFPYLSSNAVVVVHDTMLGFSNDEAISTNILFGTVNAKKYWEYEEDMDVANIAAFEITTETKKNMINSFYTLSLPWNYLPADDELKLYESVYERYYSKECIELFCKICIWQKERITSKTEKIKQNLIKHYFGRNIYLYGAGKHSNKIQAIIEKCGLKVSGFVVTEKTPRENSNNIYDREEYKNHIQNESTVLFYAIKDLDVYYELLSEGIPVAILPT